MDAKEAKEIINRAKKIKRSGGCQKNDVIEAVYEYERFLMKRIYASYLIILFTILSLVGFYEAFKSIEPIPSNVSIYDVSRSIDPNSNVALTLVDLGQ